MRRRHGLWAVAPLIALLAASPVNAGPPGPSGVGWADPERVWDGPYSESSFVAVGAKVHIAATGQTGIWYLTNRTGTWTRTRLSTFPGDIHHDTHGRPAIARDASDGSLTVAWVVIARADESTICQGGGQRVRYRTLHAGTWTPAQSVPHTVCFRDTALQVHDGAIALAADVGPFHPPDPPPSHIAFVTNASGFWSSSTLSGRGAPSLQVAGDGTPRMAFEREAGCCPSRVVYARGTTLTGGFVTETAAYGWDPSLALTATGSPRISYTNAAGANYAWRDAGGWHQTLAMPGMNGPATLALDADGPAHIAASDGANGLWHGTNASGTWSSEQIDTHRARELAGIDHTATGIIHVVHGRGIDDNARIWYTRSN